MVLGRWKRFALQELIAQLNLSVRLSNSEGRLLLSDNVILLSTALAPCLLHFLECFCYGPGLYAPNSKESPLGSFVRSSPPSDI